MLPAGVVDTHIHTSPDVIPRRWTDLELAQHARDAGYRGFVLKNHHSLTATRAALVSEAVPGVTALGGIALNPHAVGGLDPVTVWSALQLGARVVWMPTIGAQNQLDEFSAGGGEALLRAMGIVKQGFVLGDPVAAAVDEILRLIADHGATLATGHLSPPEIMRLVPYARSVGIERVLITHPELPVVGLTMEQQLELAELGGVYFERCFVTTLPNINVPMRDIAQQARTVGPASTVMATDLGQDYNLDPVTGMEAYVDAMRNAGFSTEDIEVMVCRNPAAVLRLDGKDGP
jgi:hypothetical protein